MADLRDVDESLDARCELDERAERHDLRHAAGHGAASLERIKRRGAGVGDELLQSEADLRRRLREVELQHLHGDDLPDLHDVCGALHALVREIGDVDESIDATDVGERAVRLHRRDGRGARLTDLEHCEELLALFRTLGRDDRLATHDEAVLVLVQLDDLHRELLADEDRDVGDVADVDLAGRHEGAVMRDLHLEAALVHARATRLDDLSDLERAPVGLLRGAFETQDREALERIEALDHEAALAAHDRRLLVADLQELRERADALRSWAELDEHVSVVHADDRPLAHLAASRRGSLRRGGAFEILDRHAAEGGLDLSLELSVVAVGAGGGSGLRGGKWVGRHDGRISGRAAYLPTRRLTKR